MLTFNRWVVFAGVATLLLAAVIGMAELYASHPYEDAYITFQYVENAARGHGIVYNAGGPRTEGLVDFLWFAVLTVLVRLGADVAVAAILMNALGAAVIAGILTALLSPVKNFITKIFFCALAVGAACFSDFSLAGYGGFSSAFFCAWLLMLLALTVDARPRALLVLPFVALGATLARPEGAIVGAYFVFAGFVTAGKTAILRRYIISFIAALFFAALYFAWRFSYFGLLLPLPLYVKSSGVGWSGVVDNWHWLTSRTHALTLFFTLIFLTAAKRFCPDRPVSRVFRSLIPFVLLWLSFAIAHQAQNINYRFQSPLIAALLFALFFSAARLYAAGKKPVLRVLVALIFALSLAPTVVHGFKMIVVDLKRPTTQYFYANGPLWGKILRPEHRMAVTEAGLLAYWTTCRVEDIAGLNSPVMALKPATDDTLRTLDPDVILFHHAGTFNLRHTGAGKSEPLVRLKPGTLGRSVDVSKNKLYPGIFTNGIDRYVLYPAYIAPLLLGHFLQWHEGEYDIYATYYWWDDYLHVIGLRKTLDVKEELLAALRRALGGETISYGENKGFPMATVWKKRILRCIW